ncbi:MAG: hypothetical protein NVS2B16_36630 [Chloroflexota bacterium]
MAAVVLVGGIGVRIVILRHQVPPTSDEALAGLMANDLLHGHPQAFLWGQPYGGVPEVGAVAVLTRLFGPSLYTLRATTVVLGLVSAGLGWRVSRRLTGSWASAVTGAVLWLWPLYFVAWSLQEFLYYVPLVAVGLGSILLALRTAEDPSRHDLVLLGFALGVGWWISPAIAYFALPAIAVVLPVVVRLGRRLVLSVVALLVGAGPWIWANVTRPLASLHIAPLAEHSSYVDRLGIFIHNGWPLAVGLQRVDGTLLLGDGIQWSYAILAAFVLTSLVVLGHWGITRKGALPADALGLLALPFLYALSPSVATKHQFNLRYFFFTWPFIALVFTRIVSRLPKPVVVIVPLGLVAASLVFVRSQPVLPNNFANRETLERGLESHGIAAVYASYWVAYDLDFFSKGRIIATPAAASVTRDPRYRDLVARSPHPAWIFIRSSLKERFFLDGLSRLSIRPTSFESGNFVVYTTEVAVRPSDLPPEALANAPEGA